MISKKIKSIIISVTMSITLLFSGTVFADSSQVKVNVERLAGADRYETNLAIVNHGWTNADNVILVNGSAFADAIVASPLSKKLNAPILLAQSSTDMYVALQEIQKLGAKNIYILGGTGVISSAMENGLKNQGYNVTRIAGNSRYETSIEVAKYVNSNPSTIFFTDGDNWEDALSIAPVAAKLQAPIILGSRTTSSDEVNNYLANISSSKITILDDNAFSGTKGVNETSGLVGSKLLIANNPLDMNENIIKQYKDQLNFNNVYLASSSTFADALSGSGLASIEDNPIILYNRDNRSSTYNIFNSNKNSIQNVEVLGGEGAIGDDGISNVFDITGLVESTDGNTTNNNSSNTNNGDNDQGNINLTNTSDDSDFGDFDKGSTFKEVLHNNITVIATDNDTVVNKSNSDLTSFLRSFNNTNYSDQVYDFISVLEPEMDTMSENTLIGNRSILILTKKATSNNLTDTAIAIEYDKGRHCVELYIKGWKNLSNKTFDILRNKGYNLISNDSERVALDMVTAVNNNTKIMNDNSSAINKMLNSENHVYFAPNKTLTEYGSYYNGVYTIGGKMNDFVTFVTYLQ